MSGQIVGYKRVSTVEQNTESQLSGVELHKIFIDKVSGSTIDRPELEAMLNYVREGDEVVVNSMDRLARNLFDLQGLVKQLTSGGVKIRFIREKLEFTGDDSPMANLMLSVMGAVAQFERELIRERQREGIKLAKARGAFSKSGRNRKFTPEEAKAAVAAAFTPGVNRSAVAREFGVSRNLLYKLKREQLKG